MSEPTIPQFRLLVCPLGLADLAESIFSQIPSCAVARDMVLTSTGHRHASQENLRTLLDPSIYCSMISNGRRFLVCVEDLENGPEAHGTLRLLLNNTVFCEAVKPAFIIQDPIRLFNSWKKLDWDMGDFVQRYTSVQRMMDEAPSGTVSSILYERLVQDSQTKVEQLCAKWDVPFDPEGFHFPGQNDTHHDLISNAEKALIERQLGRLYLNHWKEETSNLRQTLMLKTWIGFDLDDTLHEFRRASSAATNSVLEAISQVSGIPFKDLKEQYKRILQTKTSNAFSDGKTSHDYRRERFTALAEHFSIILDPPFYQTLLDLYEAKLMDSLELTVGALDLLSTLKKLGKKTVVITEGPQDAQERTIQGLGIAEHIDFLATSNNFGLAKTEGLFSKALNYLGISAADVAFIGDSEERDVQPTSKEGIFCIHLAATQDISLDTLPPRVNTLKKIELILSA